MRLFTAKLILSSLFATGLLLLVGTIAFIIKTNPKNVAQELKSKLALVARPSDVFDRDGQRLGSFVEESRIQTPLAQIPLHVQRAFLAAEDQHFYQHNGISALGILRSAWINLRRDRVAQGGSTITQQLVRQFLLSRDRTFSRKIREIDLSLRLERQLTKQQILELWLNHVYLGNNAWGVGAAAQHYFHKSVSELSVGEAAILAGLPQAPSRYAPHIHPEASRARKNYVLRRMKSAGWLSSQDAAYWQNAKITVWRDRKLLTTGNPWITESVRVELWKKLDARQLPRTGIKIETTIDGKWQQVAQNLVRKNFQEFANSGLEMAMISVDISTGETRAMIGGIDFNKSQFNRALNLSRPFGESIYPMIFGWSIDEGVTTVPGYQSLGAAAIQSSFHEADRAAAAMGYNVLQKKFMNFSIRERDVAAIDQARGSPMNLAQIWRSIAGRPLLQNNLISKTIQSPNMDTQSVRGRGLPIESMSETAAYSVKAWLMASGFSGHVGEELRVQGDSSWNHWDVAVGPETITTVWVGVDRRTPKDPESFRRIKERSTKFLDAWLVASGSVLQPKPVRPVPAGLSWQMVRRPNGQISRIPFPVLAH